MVPFPVETHRMVNRKINVKNVHTKPTVYFPIVVVVQHYYNQSNYIDLQELLIRNVLVLNQSDRCTEQNAIYLVVVLRTNRLLNLKIKK